MSLDACAEIVRRHDHDRYLCALFAPPACRAGLFALYAFNHEIAKTREVVSEPMLGHIRLQWWRESLDGAFAGQPRQHEVLQPLAAAIVRHTLPRAPFDRLIAAREHDLEPQPPADLAGLLDYCDATAGSLSALALGVLCVGDPELAERVRAVSIAWALTGLLRASAHLARSRQLIIPHSLQRECGVVPGDYNELRVHDGLRAAVAGLVQEARSQLRAGREPSAASRRGARAVLLQGVLAERYLRTIAACGHDPFDPRVAAAHPGRIWRLVVRAAFGAY